MYTRPPQHHRCILFSLAAMLAISGLGAGRAIAQSIITKIIDSIGECAAGNGIDAPQGITVDADGNVYVTGRGSDNAFKITPAGAVTEIIDCMGDGTGNCSLVLGNVLDDPRGIAVDAAGNIFVTGRTSDNAFMITPAGAITEIIDLTGDGAGNGLDGPNGIAVDGVGNAYVAGERSDNVFKITPGGVVTQIIGAGDGLNGPVGIAVDGAGNVYVAGFASDNAFKITPGGVITEIIDCTGDGTGDCIIGGAGNSLRRPFGIAVDGAGNVFVPGFFTDNAFKITPGGVITKIIDSTGDGAGSVLDSPCGIAVDGAGNAYVTGQNSDNAFRITPGGVITEIIDCTGDGTGDCIFLGEGNNLDTPTGIAVDAAGNVYVAGIVSDNAFEIALDLDGDGVPDLDDACPNTPVGLPVDCDGQPLRDCNGDCLYDAVDIQCLVDEMLNQ